MNSQRLRRRQLRERARPQQRAEPNGEVNPTPRELGDGAATLLATPDETLVADPRGYLTPAQMVDERLRLLLGGSPRSLYQNGRLVNYRRIARR